MTDKVVVVGLGEIGLSIYTMISKNIDFLVYGIDKDQLKSKNKETDIKVPIDYLHICIRCSHQQSFVNIVCKYIVKFKPKLVIIHSTVPPLTTNMIHNNFKSISIVHSPVIGMHKSMDDDIKLYTKFFGSDDIPSTLLAKKHLEQCGFKTKFLGSTVEMELAKLFSTSYVGIMITAFQEMHRISKYFGADFSNITPFISDIHKHRLDRPLWFPSAIGGHCIMENINILNHSYYSSLFRWVHFSNGIRFEEIEKDPSFALETKKIEKQFKEMRKWSKKKVGAKEKE